MDVIRHPSYLADWWYELPSRRTGWWRWLLFEEGQGWLKWRMDIAETPGSYEPPEPPEPYAVAPPLRRLAMALRYRSRWPFELRDHDRERHAAW